MMRNNYPTIPNFSDLERLFDFAAPTFGRLGRFFENHSPVSTPAADFYEDDNNYYIRAELPGVRKDDIAVQLDRGQLTISGTRKQVRNDSELLVKYHRSVNVPEDIATDDITARHEDGILTLTLPKAPRSKVKQIEVK